MKLFRITRLLTIALAGLGLSLPTPAADTSAKKSKTTAAETDTPRAAKTAKVDLNTADLATLETLPGVGPQTAQAIVAARPFASVAQLEEVPGIGPVKMKELKSKVTASKVTVAKKDPTPAKSVAANGDRKKEPSAKKSASSEVATTRTPAAPRPETRASRADDDRPPTPTGRPSAMTHSSANARAVNLNTATRAELEALPEIGPVKAQAIIDARPFSSIEDVMRVSGIKEGTFAVIKDQITVR